MGRMIVKDAQKYNSMGTVRKKNKMKKATRNPVVVTDDDDTQFILPTKRDKKKHPVEGNSSNHKRKKNLGSNLKNAESFHLPVIRSSLDSVEEAEKPPKGLKRKRPTQKCQGWEQEANPEIPSQGQTTKSQEANFLGKKHRKTVLDPCGGDSGCSIKKKKKKCKLTCSLIPSLAEDNYSSKYLLPTMKTIPREIMLTERKKTLIHISVSKRKTERICCLASADSQGTTNGVLEQLTEDPAHELQEDNNCHQDHQDTAHVLKKRRDTTKQKRKKKWKKKLKEKEGDFILTPASNQENHPAETLLKTKSWKKQAKTVLIQNSEEGSRGLKKKKIYTKVANSYPDQLNCNEVPFDWERKAALTRLKKKAEKAKKEKDRAARLESDGSRANGDKQCNATKKKRKSERSEGHQEESSSNLAKLKKEAKEKEDEIQVVAVKKGNCDEVRIDKSRRQALQEEIDRESGKTKVVKEEDESDHRFGQWSTATFDSAEQKSKFLRLLGGFKKGPVSNQNGPAKARQQNMALARHGEEQLQQSLQAEFEKAVDWKQWRGAGLGFHPAPQKWMRIDKYASKSVKFED